MPATKQAAPKGRVVNAASAKPKYAPRQRKEQAVALDEYLALEEQAGELSKAKCAARDNVLSLVDHGDIVAASDGRSRLAIDETVDTNQHAKVVQAIARDFGIDEADVAAYYAATHGSKHDRDLKKV